jgi:hypothetical protein
MPQYHSHEHPYLGQIIITPLPFWRNWFRFLPYFVGDSIRFRIQIETPQEQPTIYEKFGNNEVIEISHDHQSNEKEKEILGNPISSEGDVEYRVGFNGSPSGNLTKTIVTARAINKDRWFPYVAGVLLGVLLTAIAQILTGFLDVVKSWRIWIP